MSKIEGKTNFSRGLKQFDGLTCLTLTPSYFTTDLRATGYTFLLIVTSDVTVRS